MARQYVTVQGLTALKDPLAEDRKAMSALLMKTKVKPCTCCDSHCKKCCGCYIDIGRGKSCAKCEKCQKHCKCA